MIIIMVIIIIIIIIIIIVIITIITIPFVKKPLVLNRKKFISLKKNYSN